MKLLRSQLAQGVNLIDAKVTDNRGASVHLVVYVNQDIVCVYKNECKHLPIMLTASSGAVANVELYDGVENIRCSTHGARYRLTDGLCTEGPCEGTTLDQFTVTVKGDVCDVDLKLLE